MPNDPIDVHHLGLDHAVGSYLIDTDDGPALVDVGPQSTEQHLLAGLAQRGLALTDVRHLLLTHIHFDHAGAAGALVRRNPDLQVWVSSVGAPHLIDPERLERSARRLYQDQFDQLWGEIVPIPAANVHALDDDVAAGKTSGDVLGMHWISAPGHASHHVAWAHPDGTVYTGDSAGVRIQPYSTVLPVAPPPDVDVPGWHATIERIRGLAPKALGPTHFGIATDVERHLTDLETRLDDWVERVRNGMTQDEFPDFQFAEIENGDGTEALAAYEGAGPAFLSWSGLNRYIEQSGLRTPA